MKSLKTNAILNTVKTLMGLIFPLITFPYLSRVLGVNNIGKINFSSSVVSYFILIAGLGVSRYAIREGAAIRNNTSQVSMFVSEVFSINMISTIFSYILLFLVILFVEPLREYRNLIILYSIEIFFTTVGVEWVFSIFENYLYITVRSILVQLISLLLILIVIKGQNDYYKYVIIIMSTSLIANTINFLSARKICSIKLVFNKSLFKHILPILTIFSISVATSIYVNSDITMLGILAGDYSVGIYSMATKVYSIVKQLLAAMIVVTVPRLSYVLKNESLKTFKEIGSEVLNSITVLLIPAVFGLLFNAEKVVILLGGEEYTSSKYSLMILAGALFFSIFSSFFSMSVLLPLKMEKKIFCATSISAVVNIVLNIVLIPVLFEKAAAFTTLISELISCLFCYIYARNYIKVRAVFTNIFKCLIGVIPIILISYNFNKLGLSNNLSLILIIIFSGILYFFVEILLRNKYILTIMNEVKSKMKRQKTYF